MGDWPVSSPEQALRHYEMHWLSALEWGTVEAQEASMYALRSHGWEIEGCDYGSAFHWHIVPPEDHPQNLPWFQAHRIDPDKTPDYGDPMAERPGGVVCSRT